MESKASIETVKDAAEKDDGSFEKSTDCFPVLPEGRAKMCALKTGDSKQKEMLEKLKNQGMSLRPKKSDTKPAADKDLAAVSQNKEKVRGMCVLSALKTPLSQVLRKSIEASENKKEIPNKLIKKNEGTAESTEKLNQDEKNETISSKEPSAVKMKRSAPDTESGMALRQKSTTSAKLSPSLRSHSSKRTADNTLELNPKRRTSDLTDVATKRNKNGSNVSNSSSSSSSSRGEDSKKGLVASAQTDAAGKLKKNKKRHFRGGTYGLYLTPAKKKKKLKQKSVDESKDDECSLAGTENSSYLDSEDGNSLVSEDFYTPSERSLADEERPDSRNSATHLDQKVENYESNICFENHLRNPESSIGFSSQTEHSNSNLGFGNQTEQSTSNVNFAEQGENIESNIDFEGPLENSESNLDCEEQQENSESNIDFEEQLKISKNNEEEIKKDNRTTPVISNEEMNENATDGLPETEGIQWKGDKKFEDSSSNNNFVDDAPKTTHYDDISNESFSNSAFFSFKNNSSKIENLDVKDSDQNVLDVTEEKNDVNVKVDSDEIINGDQKQNPNDDVKDEKMVSENDVEGGTLECQQNENLPEDNEIPENSASVNIAEPLEENMFEVDKENVETCSLNEGKDEFPETNDSQSTIANCVKSRQRIKRRFTDDIVDTDLGLLSLDPATVVRKVSSKPVISEPVKDVVLTFQSVHCEGRKPVTSKLECIFNSRQKPVKTCTCDAELIEANFVHDDDGDFCQAVDTVDDKLIGCSNPIVTTKLGRSAMRLSFTVMCEMHLWRLKHHQSCPYCGVFCSQGSFMQCVTMKNKKMVSHLFHEQCQPKEEGQPLFCPHCGATSGMKRVNVSLQMANPPAFYFNQLQNLPVPYISKAKISFSATSEFLKKEEEDLFNEQITIESSGNILCSAGLPAGPEKENLEKLLKDLNEDKIKIEPSSVDSVYDAAERGDIEKILNLLANGFNPNYKFSSHEGGTALHAAATAGHVVIVHLLIQAGAVHDSFNDRTYTPLMLAAENGHKDVVHYLVKKGACVDFKGDNGMSSLHLAAKCGNLDVLKTLMTSREVDVNAQDDGGWTPIVWASEHDHYDAVKFLLKKGANPNIRDNEGNIGLHWSAFSGSVEICYLYLEYGCDVNAVNELGDSPLHIAARQDSLPCVTLFLSRGADVQILNKSNQLPAECVIDKTSETYLSLSLNMILKKITAKYQHRAEKIIYRDISRGKEQIPIQCVNGFDDETAPLDFLYVTENCETMPINIDRAITSLQSCRCEDDCSTTSCTCASVSYKCWYDKDGLLLPEFNLIDPPMLFECNRGCSCWTLNCQNRVLQNGITARLQLIRTKGKGWGVRTLKDIPRGSFICEYVGELISDSVADKRTDDSYLFDLDNRDGETYCLDARYYGNISRFINHLCDPNLVPVKIYVDHQDLNFPRIAFFSSREIKQYEELGFDYGEKFWVIKYKHFTCECGTPKCKYSKETIHNTIANYYRRLKEEQLEEAAASQQLVPVQSIKSPEVEVITC